ncbi:MAG: BlaI/MecI/CopY family transcriptional regulator [Bacteroidota bacterium]
MAKPIPPTPREMGIIRILWRLGPSTVRQVHEALLQEPGAKQVGYTTTLKFMQIMLDKKLLTRTTENRIHIYTPTISEKENVQEVLDDIVERTYRGSRSRLVMQILGGAKTTKAELQKIREFLDDLEENPNS